MYGSLRKNSRSKPKTLVKILAFFFLATSSTVLNGCCNLAMAGPVALGAATLLPAIIGAFRRPRTTVVQAPAPETEVEDDGTADAAPEDEDPTQVAEAPVGDANSDATTEAGLPGEDTAGEPEEEEGDRFDPSVLRVPLIKEAQGTYVQKVLRQAFAQAGNTVNVADQAWWRRSTRSIKDRHGNQAQERIESIQGEARYDTENLSSRLSGKIRRARILLAAQKKALRSNRKHLSRAIQALEESVEKSKSEKRKNQAKSSSEDEKARRQEVVELARERLSRRQEKIDSQLGKIDDQLEEISNEEQGMRSGGRSRIVLRGRTRLRRKHS